MLWLNSEDRPSPTSEPGLLDQLPTEVLTAALGSMDKGKEMTMGTAGRVQGRGFEVTEIHPSLAASEPGVHDTRDKEIHLQTPAWPPRSDRPRQGNAASEPQLLTLQNDRNTISTSGCK